MEKPPFIWFNGQIMPWADAKIHVITHSLHYGSAVFEGERFYKTGENETAIFRLADHTKRLFYSASVLKMDIPFSVEEINAVHIDLLAKNGLSSGYIRPLAFFGEKMGLNPKGAPVETLIAAWGWGKYLADKPLSVKISKYIRIHPKSLITDAKVSGYYANSIFASQEIEGEYDEALLLDFNGNVAEGPGENIFMVKNGEIFTPALGSILPGITRDSIMTIARDLGYRVTEKELSPDDLFTADELFFTGSAAEVSAIGTLDDRQISDGNEGKITKIIKTKYFDAVQGKAPEYEAWLTRIAI
ncbi:MAG: branched-chain amino acid transaminase [Candidatus Peregrinibacteria bacterium]